jgi:hypothetical protein
MASCNHFFELLGHFKYLQQLYGSLHFRFLDGTCFYNDVFDFSSYQEVLAKGQQTIGSVDNLQREKEAELMNASISSMPKST